MHFSKIKSRLIPLAMTICILIMLLGCPAITAAAGSETGHWPTLDEVQGQAWLVLDNTTGQVLLEKNADQKQYPASTTKILTAILALESGKLDNKATVSAEAVALSSNSSKAGFVAGEVVVLRDVLYGLMLPSGNDAANILAEALAGSQEEFAKLMNEKARKIGMTKSSFCNPSGMHNFYHFVTARDMAKLAVYAMKNAEFRKIVSTATYSLPATNLHPLRGWGLLLNTNRFLEFGDTALQSDLIAKYEGIKTGSTDNAGNNLVSAATTKTGHELICVLLGAPLSTKLSNTFVYSRTLLEEAARRIDSNTQHTTAETTGTATNATPAGTTGETTTGTSVPSESSNPVETSTQASQTTTAEVNPQPANSGILATIGSFLLDNPWRTACLFLLVILIALILLIVLYFRYQRQRRSRMNIRTRRIR